MLILTKEQARKRGVARYFTGRPCKHGHVAQRQLDGHCVDCATHYHAAYMKNHPEAMARQNVRARIFMSSPHGKRLQRVRLQSTTGRLKYRTWKKQWRVVTNNRLADRLRARLSNAVKVNRAGSAVTLLGCTIEFARLHIERQFKPGMSWGTWGPRGWHLDHVKPLRSFDLTDPAQVAKACHYKNLQPLWWRENIRKGAR